MGQYFWWVNLDKKEYIESSPWKCGLKLVENCYVGNEKTDAALTLLSKDWEGDRVVFLGDYADFTDEDDPFRKAFWDELNGMVAGDYLFDDLTDITGKFACVKSRPNCSYYDEETDSYKAYDGPFDTDIVHFRYVVDETLGEYVDRKSTPVRFIDENGKIIRYDPVPELMSSDLFNEPEINEFTGRWFGHKIKPTNVSPDESYKRIAQRRTYWDQTIITADDSLIHYVIETEGISLFDREMSELLEEIESALAKGIVCPSCGSNNVSEILYGLFIEDHEDERWLLEEKKVLGGCKVCSISPRWYCNLCGSKFGTKPEISYE